MHAETDKQDAELTDSMKMFKWGVEGGKPAGSKPGMQPEWFYKGNGGNVVACGHAARSRPTSPRTTARSPSSSAATSSTTTAGRTGSGSPSATSSPTT